MADYKYIGGKWGRCIEGIPNRDISAEEIKRRANTKYSIDTAILDASPLYEKVTKRKKRETQVHTSDVDRA